MPPVEPRGGAPDAVLGRAEAINQILEPYAPAQLWLAFPGANGAGMVKAPIASGHDRGFMLQFQLPAGAPVDPPIAVTWNRKFNWPPNRSGFGDEWTSNVGRYMVSGPPFANILTGTAYDEGPYTPPTTFGWVYYNPGSGDTAALARRSQQSH